MRNVAIHTALLLCLLAVVHTRISQPTYASQAEPEILELLGDDQTVSTYCEMASHPEADAVYAAFSPTRQEVYLLGMVRRSGRKDRAFIIGRAKPRNESSAVSARIWCRDDLINLYRDFEPIERPSNGRL